MLYKANLATFITYCDHTVKTAAKPLKSHGMSKAVGENLVLCSETAMIRKQDIADLKKKTIWKVYRYYDGTLPSP